MRSTTSIGHLQKDIHQMIKSISDSRKKDWRLSLTENHCPKCGSTNVSVSFIDSDTCLDCKHIGGWFSSNRFKGKLIRMIQKIKNRHWVIRPYHIVLSGIADFTTTSIALSMGMPEFNPLVGEIFHIENAINLPLLIGFAWIRYEGIVYLDRKIYEKLSKKDISEKTLRRFTFIGMYGLHAIPNAIQIVMFHFMNGRF